MSMENKGADLSRPIQANPEILGSELSKFKSGFVTLIGRSNSGKSTLLNHLLKEKVSIVWLANNCFSSPRSSIGRGDVTKTIVSVPDWLSSTYQVSDSEWTESGANSRFDWLCVESVLKLSTSSCEFFRKTTA